MLRSAYFTVTLAELGSAAETALKLEASAPKIAVAIRPRRPVEGVEVFMVVLAGVNYFFRWRLSFLPVLGFIIGPPSRSLTPKASEALSGSFLTIVPLSERIASSRSGDRGGPATSLSPGLHAVGVRIMLVPVAGRHAWQGPLVAQRLPPVRSAR